MELKIYVPPKKESETTKDFLLREIDCAQTVLCGSNLDLLGASIISEANQKLASIAKNVGIKEQKLRQINIMRDTLELITTCENITNTLEIEKSEKEKIRRGLENIRRKESTNLMLALSKLKRPLFPSEINELEMLDLLLLKNNTIRRLHEKALGIQHQLLTQTKDIEEVEPLEQNAIKCEKQILARLDEMENIVRGET